MVVLSRLNRTPFYAAIRPDLASDNAFASMLATVAETLMLVRLMHKRDHDDVDQSVSARG